MADKKIIAIMGATGSQGGGLARAILSDPNGGFGVRAITHQPDSDKAKELASLGAEVVAADIEDAASLTKAFQGAYGSFCITFFWNHFSPDKEIAHAKNMAAAAKAAGHKHVIWSTLEDTRKFVKDDSMPTLQGKYKVPHFDAKGESDAAFQGLPVTYLLTTFYWDNAIYFGMGPKKGADGKYAITFPLGTKKMAGIAAGDIGKCAYGVFKDPGKFIGKTVGIAGEQLTGAEMVAKYSKALGIDVAYNAVPPAVYRGFGFPGAEDLGNMFQFYADFEDYFGKSRDVAGAKALNPGLQNFDAWLAANKSRIPLD